MPGRRRRCGESKSAPAAWARAAKCRWDLVPACPVTERDIRAAYESKGTRVPFARRRQPSIDPPSELRRRCRRVPAPVARQRPRVDSEVRARDHGGIVRGEEHRGVDVVHRTGESAQRHAGHAGSEKASSPGARVARSPERDSHAAARAMPSAASVAVGVRLLRSPWLPRPQKKKVRFLLSSTF